MSEENKDSGLKVLQWIGGYWFDLTPEKQEMPGTHEQGENTGGEAKS
jgi:hypothetical protein